MLHFKKSPTCLADSGIAPQHYQFFTTSPPCPQPNVKYFLRPNRGLLSGNWKSIRIFLKFGLCLHVTWNWFLKVLFEVENVIANNVESNGNARLCSVWENCQLENSGTRNSWFGSKFSSGNPNLCAVHAIWRRLHLAARKLLNWLIISCGQFYMKHLVWILMKGTSSSKLYPIPHVDKLLEQCPA